MDVQDEVRRVLRSDDRFRLQRSANKGSGILVIPLPPNAPPQIEGVDGGQDLRPSVQLAGRESLNRIDAAPKLVHEIPVTSVPAGIGGRDHE
jgi:hypothetical protein